MKKILFLILAIFAAQFSYSQISCTNATVRTLTSYTNGAPNDSLFYICAGQTGTLVATPPSGTPGWNFTWQIFNVPGNNWNALTTQNNVPTSTISNLQPGGYRVVITDGNAEVVGTYICWIVRINSNPSVDVSPISPGCSSILLLGSISNGSVTPYYNPPSAGVDPNASLIIGPTTSITVCFNATHTWVSDLAFYLRGPASCGSPTILLSPNPGAIGQGTVCNSGDNVSNLCFSTSSTNNLNVCAGAPFTLTGTYGTYGLNSTPINWSGLYGCDASQTGWTVQIYDCIGGDIGALTGASLTFSGTNIGGNPATYTYNTPNGFSSNIADNSCSPNTASIFTVSGQPAVPINATFGYEWTANPPFPIPNATSSLFIPLNPGPTVDTEFTLTLTGNNQGAACGGNSSDTELFDYLDAGTVSITPQDPLICEQDDPITLTADAAGGVWSGTGIIDAANGIFDPTVAGDGQWLITYTPPGGCVNPGTTLITVGNQDVISINSVSVCADDPAFFLSVNSALGTWSGTGVVDTQNGLYDPAVAGPGIWEVVYSYGEECITSDTLDLEVFAVGQATLTAEQELCTDAPDFNIGTSIPGGEWSGSGITDAVNGTFSPSTVGVGNWTVYYLPPGNCAQQSEITFSVSDQIIAQITPVGPFCSNDSPVTLTSNYQGGTWSGPGITNAETGTFNPATAGPGQHLIEFVKDGVCPIIGSTTIEVIQLPSINLTAPSQICIDAAPVTLTSNVPGGTWGGPGVNAQTGLFNPQQAGAGNAAITYTFNNVCVVTANANINVNPLPNVDAGNNVSICQGNSTTLGASGAATYSWSPNTGLSSTSVANPTATPPVGTIVYTVTGTSSAGCVSSDQVTVTVNPNPTVVVNGPLTICSGDEAQLNASGLANYLWTPANLVSNFNISNPTALLQNDQVFTVEGTSAAGCPGSATISVNVVEMSISANPVSGIAPLEVQFTNASEGGNFVWDFGDDSNYQSANVNDWPTHVYVTDSAFTATLSSTLNGTTCQVSIVINVFLESEIVLIPNVITPNGKDGNESFRIVSQNLRTLEISIFNRWGNEVGTINSPSGSWSATDVAGGTYYYTLKAEGYDNKKYERSGSFTIIKD